MGLGKERTEKKMLSKVMVLLCLFVVRLELISEHFALTLQYIKKINDLDQCPAFISFLSFPYEQKLAGIILMFVQ